jgi:hypothetical protein
MTVKPKSVKDDASREAKKMAAILLDVLAGSRSLTQAGCGGASGQRSCAHGRGLAPTQGHEGEAGRSGEGVDDPAGRLRAQAVAVESVTPAKRPHWLAVCRTGELSNPAVCIVPHYGSLARGKYRVLGVYDRPN